MQSLADGGRELRSRMWGCSLARRVRRVLQEEVQTTIEPVCHYFVDREGFCLYGPGLPVTVMNPKFWLIGDYSSGQNAARSLTKGLVCDLTHQGSPLVWVDALRQFFHELRSSAEARQFLRRLVRVPGRGNQGVLSGSVVHEPSFPRVAFRNSQGKTPQQGINS